MNAFKRFCIAALVSGILPNPFTRADTLLADFDSFSEGFHTAEMIDDGIRLFDLVNLSDPPFEPRFVVEETTSSPGPLFSPPNYITFAGYSPGPQGGLGRFHSAQIDFAGIASQASVDVFASDFNRGNRLTLAAFFGGVAVGDNSVVIGEGVQVPGSSVLSYHLNVGGVRFDSLTISVSGPTGIPDYALMGIDNVRIELIPEPGALMLFLALASTLTMYRRRD